MVGWVHSLTGQKGGVTSSMLLPLPRLLKADSLMSHPLFVRTLWPHRHPWDLPMSALAFCSSQDWTMHLSEAEVALKLAGEILRGPSLPDIQW